MATMPLPWLTLINTATRYPKIIGGRPMVSTDCAITSPTPLSKKYLLKHTSGSGYQNDQSHGQECFRGYFVQIFFVKASALAENVK